jgi:C4-dicarboxylate-binding protein DctP
MTLSRRQFTTAAGAAAASTVIGMPAVHAQSPLVIKFSHVVTADTPKGKGSIKFKELAEKYTDGKVKIEVYMNSSLYKDKEEIEALQLGAVQMLAPSTAKFNPLGIKEFEALDLPYAFADDAMFDRVVVKGETGKWLMQKLEAKGIKGLAYWDAGFYLLSANKPLLKPADYQGMKIRISGSKIADHYFRKMGSITQVMAFSELYQALQTGVVDGCENTPSNYLTQKIHEVQKHISITDHAHLHYAVIVNSKYWEGLPKDLRTQVEKAMADATDYANSIAAKEQVDALAAIKASGKCELHPMDAAQKKAWKEAMSSSWEFAETRCGKEILDMLKKATA